MAASGQLVISASDAGPLALWHLLSLDAPSVAGLWVWFIARSSHIHLPIAAPVAMVLAVWILYVADRLLDAARPHSGDELEVRHVFHHRHARAFLVAIAVASAALSSLLHLLDPAAVRLYLIEGTALAAWFVFLHTTAHPHRLPKEIAVGVFFSAAAFIPTVARNPGMREALLPDAILFAAVCSLNCLFIYAWEHDRPSRAHTTTRLALGCLPELAIIVMLAGAVLASLAYVSARPLAAGCALAAALLLALHTNRDRVARTHLRAAADLALLTPLIFLPFLR